MSKGSAETAPPIVQVNTPEGKVLRDIAKPVPAELFGTPELEDILAKMSAAMRATPTGVAIAAPQIGISLRIFVVRGYILKGKSRKEKSDEIPDVAFINPEFIQESEETEVMDEGCLSCVGYNVEIKRSTQSSVRATNENGEEFELNSDAPEHGDNAELISEIFQHEIDHLNGTLCIDNAEQVYQTIAGKLHRQEADGSFTPVPNSDDEN